MDPYADHRQSTSSEPEPTVDILKDPRFQKSNEWFGDASFASKAYPYGNLTERPKHCPNPQRVNWDVMRSVQEAEECTSSDEEDNDDEDEANGASTKKSSEKEMSVSSMLRKLATKPTMLVIRFLSWALSKVWRAAFTSIHLNNSDVAREAVHRASSRPGTALIILPTHRSHADYLLMSFLFFGLNLPVPLIAAGENLNVPLVGPLLARGGAFFIRRSQSTPRYKLVLQAYLYELARSGAPIEFFIEGGRSRRGNVGKPKVGLLGMIIQMVKDGDLQDALLLPVSLDYDSVPEGNGFANEVLGTGKKRPESLIGTVRAAFEWLIWGKRGGGVYIGFSDRILSVSDLIAKFSKYSSASSFSIPPEPSLTLKRNNSSHSEPGLIVGTSASRRKGMDQEEDEKLPLTSGNSGGIHHQLHHHHPVPPPGAIFRGGSGVSLANSFMDDSIAHDIGRVVVEAQREAALITMGGVTACAMLMAGHDAVDTLEAIHERASQLLDLLIQLGNGHRIPDGTLTTSTLQSDVEQTVETLGGENIAQLGGAKARVCLRYAASPVLIRLLPVFVVCLNEDLCSDFHSWLAGMFDVQIDQNDVLRNNPEEDEWDLSQELKKGLCELIAPAVIILSTALDGLSSWRNDTIVSENEAVEQVRDMLSGAPFPELSAPLEINAAFRASVIHSVLKRTPIETSLTNKKKENGYELHPTFSVPLMKGRVALTKARQELGRVLSPQVNE